MSFNLVDSGNLYCTARSGKFGRGFFNDRVNVGDYEIEIGDFCALVEYVFTNTDLEDDDIRLTTLERLKKLKPVKGYNGLNVCLGYSQD